MLNKVSSHAIIRYVERVLGQPVDEWLAGTDKMREADRAAMVCQRAGLPVDAVRELILCPAVRTMIVCNFNQVIVRLDGFAYVIRSGVVATVLTERMREERIGLVGKMRDVDRNSKRREIIRNNRRAKDKNKNKNRDRRKLEGVE